MSSNCHNRGVIGVLASVLITGLALDVAATVPPRPGVKFPNTYIQRLKKNPRAFTYRRSLIPLAQRVRAARIQAFGGPAGSPAAAGFAVTGKKTIPILSIKFKDTTADPFAIGDLQRELFDGPWPTGTMTDFYREISYGRFEVTGTVLPWKTLSKKGSFYTGNCNGLCPQAKLPALIAETIAANAATDWGQYDNEGPDGVPNSGDDDGFVDFVAFVQPNIGGECGNNPHMWSHRFSLTGWGETELSTKSPRKGGGVIKVDDYVIMPALACDGKTMIQIGVFCHEFGHAFGLPDLYDTDEENGVSEGVGNWCLMAGGSWGGDGNSPQRPAHMSAWSKSFLGWVLPKLETGNVASASIPDAESNAFAYKVPISQTQYYLIENRQRSKFDEKLPIGGLLVWRINDTVVTSGLTNNRVNADESNQGVELVEADGRSDLDGSANRGDAGDPFPGSRNARTFDKTTKPASVGQLALCDIGDPGAPMTARLSMSGGCSTTAPAPAPDPNPAAAPPQATAAAPARGQAAQGTTGQEAVRVTIAELQKNAAAYAGKTLKVTGTLENAGRNYFTDRRLVLRQTNGTDSVSVRWPGMPLEVPPRPPGASRSRPATLSDYLGKNIEAVGVLERTTQREGLAGYTFTIQSATRSDPKSPDRV